jgi:DNA polymerase V
LSRSKSPFARSNSTLQERCAEIRCFTSPKKPLSGRYCRNAHGEPKTIHLPDSSADTLDLINAARRGARAVFREGYAYAKAGIIMDDLIPAGNGTRPLFDARDREKSGRLMSVLDAINEKFGHGALMPAATGIKKREWEAKLIDRRSPRYTTRLDELPHAAAN